jgi:hypothetical protein
VLAVLWFARGEAVSPVDTARLADVVPVSVGFVLRQIRQAMAVEAIDHERGQGHRLTEVGRAEIEEAIADMQAAVAEVAWRSAAHGGAAHPCRALGAV